jgi:quercetin dioxygenase-like cupin family protein
MTEPSRIPAAEAVALAGLVDYGPGAVVSRTLTKGKPGTLTLFAFDAGQGLSEHAAPFDAYVLLVEGEMQLTIGGRPLTAKVGELVLMPANVPHALEAREQAKMLLVMLRA